MNIDQAKAHLAELKAKCQVVEWFIEDGCIDVLQGTSWNTLTYPDLDAYARDYRRTPRPTYVPFTLDTFPKCPVWVRTKPGVDSCPRIIGEVMVTGVNQGGLRTDKHDWGFDQACRELEISLDHRQTWQPCGERKA